MIIEKLQDLDIDYYDPAKILDKLPTEKLNTDILTTEDLQARDDEVIELLNNTALRGRTFEEHKNDILIGITGEALIYRSLGIPYSKKKEIPIFCDLIYNDCNIEIKTQKHSFSGKYPIQFYLNAIKFALENKYRLDYFIILLYTAEFEYQVQYITFPNKDINFMFFHTKFANSPDLYLSSNALVVKPPL